MEDIILIKTEHGSVSIRLDGFFPTTQRRCKQLKKVMLEDWQNEETLILSVQKYLGERIKYYLSYENADLKKADKLRKNLTWMLA